MNGAGRLRPRRSAPTTSAPTAADVEAAASDRPLLIAVVGPTAAGKTELAIAIATELGGEIISADSRQIYRGMDVGTAKATPAQQAAVPHYLLDVVNPDQVITLAEYQRLAFACIADVQARGRVPFLVGGTGQYVQAVTEGWVIPAVAPDANLRAGLEAEARTSGSQALHDRLGALDPLAAARINHRNLRRVIRALEVCLTTGHPISELQARRSPPFRPCWLGVTRPRAELYARIDARVDRMMAEGLVEEVRCLMDAGYGLHLPAMSGLGYRQIGEYLGGDISLDEAVRRIKKQTRRFVQQQYNWFRLDDPRVHWVDPGRAPFTLILALVREWLAPADCAPGAIAG